MTYNNLYKGFTGASFIVTEACNLRCTYCFENCKIRSKESMSKEVIDAGMRMLFDNAIAEQQENERQISNIYSDYGSGLNYKRKNWNKLIDDCFEGKISK